MRKITQSEDARVLRHMKVPLNTPIEQGMFSPSCYKHWARLENAHDRFMIALRQYSEASLAESRDKKWQRLRRRLNVLDKAAGECVQFLGGLAGNVQPLALKPEQDEPGHALLEFLVRERAAPFIQFWREAFDAVEEGIALRIERSDIPPWFDDEP
jgi:hypothetical protein